MGRLRLKNILIALMTGVAIVGASLLLAALVHGASALNDHNAAEGALAWTFFWCAAGLLAADATASLIVDEVL